MNAIELQRQQLVDEIQALPADVLQEASDFIARLKLKTVDKERAAIQVRDSTADAASSSYEGLKDLIGCGEGPADLAANHKKYIAEYMEEKYPRYASDEMPQPSLQEIAQLPINERHLLLAKQVAKTAEDFANDPALTEFSEIDLSDWSADSVGA
ncbi:MAG: hypothetical protein AAFR25_10425 [Cyanobacteria bacterium J06629_19]